MEEKRREAGSPSPAATISGGSSIKSGESPATEPPPPRRRGQKRKSTNSSSGASSAPPKRHAREKAAAAAAAASGGFFSLLPPTHNGPLTRARQLSDSNAAIFSALNAGKHEASMAAANDAAISEGREEVNVVNEECKKLQAVIEAEFDEIRTRDLSVHVVPVAAGWFSWKNIHLIEKHMLQSFFNGKKENRTPDTYKEIRNWILKKFHANPSTNIELKDLSELSIGDLDARQEIMEFLDHWGLINYHPFLQNDPANVDADPNTDTADKAEKKNSLIEKLYQFESEQSSLQLVPRANMSAATVPSGLFPESIAEELVKQEGPAVEYHCNSCSADCSRKRYHCQKQADFDLCTDCYNNGKFGSGMCSSDFILMEPAEASGATGGKWTDQETLLLLEALELYKENWNEIAEHVATKTKAQCILHFLQMPIEDSFLDYDYTKDSALESGEPTSTNNISPVLKDDLEPSEGGTVKDNSGPADNGSGKDNSEPLANRSNKDNAEPLERETDSSAAQPVSTQTETSNLEDTPDGEVPQGAGDDVVIKALKEAFHVAGWPLTPEDTLSFAEAGNSVMALAAFLTQLVEPDLATASACSSLKTISRSSPGSRLAIMHCFILEDPPDDEKEHVSESMAAENIDQNASEMAKEDLRNEKDIRNTEEKSIPVLDETRSTDGQILKTKDPNTKEDPQLPTGEQDTYADNSSFTEKPTDEEMPQVAEKTEEKSEVREKPDEERPQVTEKPDEEIHQNTEKPDEEMPQVREKSDKEIPQVTEKPDSAIPQVTENPDKEVPQVREKPDEELPKVTEKPNEEIPKGTEKLDEEMPQVEEKPDEEMPQVKEKPDEENSQVTEQRDEEKVTVAEKHDEVTNTEQLGTKSEGEAQNCSLQNEQSPTTQKDQATTASEAMPPPGKAIESENLKTAAESVQCTDAPKNTNMEATPIVSDKTEEQDIGGTVPMVGVASEAVV
ncbi:SWI/SNF complex subunit SWI3D isoform X4 [Beta vulgaris subsp. vulgaris]|uniref:SWI/SNF complex subunit SWI3D isoform X4 n=1 Tax=Beta vulgaris subsp. vulgaris TaxID=3555 RepID=UPI0020370AF8|nr:SWI/SNF complex subunit SWI3D isoform X4 [Beta vulgaris subsp. vulgaris]